MSDDTLLQVRRLKKHFPLRGGVFATRQGSVRAVDDVSFAIRAGETLGLVGESGCGKSTLGRALTRLDPPTDGEVLFKGRDLARASKSEIFASRREMQMIFQDPYSSLNPRMTVGEIVREPLVVHRIGNKREQRERVGSLLRTVGLEEAVAERYPHEFSGGQRQRVGIARALALKPDFVIADEPVSALDVSVQSQVLNLMVRLQRELGLTYLFISHDLSVVEYISDRIAIMYLGKIVEIGPVDAIFQRPAHPYTRALMDAVPVADPRRRRDRLRLKGETPNLVRPPQGCAFRSRCPFAIDDCQRTAPPLEPLDPTATNDHEHKAACIRKNEI